MVTGSARRNGWAAEEPPQGLIVVEDHSGDPALPYHRALNLLLEAIIAPASLTRRPVTQPATDEDMPRVRSTRLEPGDIVARAIRAPGLPPTFVIGDDPR